MSPGMPVGPSDEFDLFYQRQATDISLITSVAPLLPIESNHIASISIKPHTAVTLLEEESN